MKNLNMDIRGLQEHTNKLPQEALKELGITYIACMPQPMADSWWFLGVDNVPEVLPKWLEYFMEDNNYRQWVGFGLSEKDCIRLENKDK